MCSQIVVWILHLTEVQQVTHILVHSFPPLPPPHSSLPSPYLPIPTLSSPSELVGTPSSGDGPPTWEWVLTGVASSSQLGSKKGNMINMECIEVREVRAHQKAYQEFQHSLQALQGLAGKRFLKEALQESQSERIILQQSPQKWTSSVLEFSWYKRCAQLNSLRWLIKRI